MFYFFSLNLAIHFEFVSFYTMTCYCEDNLKLFTNSVSYKHQMEGILEILKNAWQHE